MKKMVALLSVVICLLAGSAFAETVSSRIQNVNCSGGVFGLGGVTVAYTGLDYFNITATNAFGWPFSEQAQIVDMRADSVKMGFELAGLISGQHYALLLYQGTTQGLISVNGNDTDLTCDAHITPAP
jgi:non-ribosomal peptide synthetase component E (peptide arylation enzyme)